MRTEMIKVTRYEFKDFSEEMQEKILENYREFNVFSDWYEYTIDRWTDILRTIGVIDSEIHFSGFSHQGSGACFIGKYSYSKGALKFIKQEYPQAEELIQVVKQLQDVQKRNFYGIEGEIFRTNHHYNHENCVTFQQCFYAERCVSDEDVHETFDLFRDLMQQIYSELENEYNHLTSDNAIKETFESNGYEFDENGDIV